MTSLLVAVCMEWPWGIPDDLRRDAGGFYLITLSVLGPNSLSQIEMGNHLLTQMENMVSLDTSDQAAGAHFVAV